MKVPNLTTGRKLVAVALVAVTLAGCYGPFNLTRRLHDWNGQVGEQWANEGIFLVCVIFPVYFFATLGDAVIFNSIEFWGGENPIAPPEGAATASAEGERVFTDGDRTVVISRATTADGRTLVVRVFEQDALVDQLTLEARTGAPTVLRDASGAVLGEATTASDGSVSLVGAGERLSADEIALLRSRLAGRLGSRT